MIGKIHRIKTWQAALIIAIIGFAVYGNGLVNAFEGDDSFQIVNNIPVHSLTNIRLFFEGGTFYEGAGLTPLSGLYYRPIMSTLFSLIYTVFGPHRFYFHLVQLILCIGSAVLLFILFRFFFKPALALCLSLVFLVHPINSEVIYEIACLQDALFLFFGLSTLVILMKFKSGLSMVAAAGSLLLSLLSKETGIIFLVMSLAYLFLWDAHKRLYRFMLCMLVPTALWLFLKINAVGLNTHPTVGPIDYLSLAQRLLTVPSIVFFYAAKFVFPWKLASAYYWSYPTFSLMHVMLPLVADLILLGIIVYGAFMVHSHGTNAQFKAYLFFGLWLLLGLLTIIQIIPLDMTASEAWFYFPMIGLLGMMGVLFSCLRMNIKYYSFVYATVVLIIVILGTRSMLRGFDWRTDYTLAVQNYSSSKSDYTATNTIALHFMNEGKYAEAKNYADSSISVFPTAVNYDTLGVIDVRQGNIAGAISEYENGLKRARNNYVAENIGALMLVSGSYAADKAFFQNALFNYPHDSALWTSFALWEDKLDNNSEARVAIKNANEDGRISQPLYQVIMQNAKFTYVISTVNKRVEIPAPSQ